MQEAPSGNDIFPSSLGADEAPAGLQCTAGTRYATMDPSAMVGVHVNQTFRGSLRGTMDRCKMSRFPCAVRLLDTAVAVSERMLGPVGWGWCSSAWRLGLELAVVASDGDLGLAADAAERSRPRRPEEDERPAADQETKTRCIIAIVTAIRWACCGRT